MYLFVDALQESGCRIDIENHRAGDNAMRTIRMRGNLQQTQMAQQLISQRVGPSAALTSLQQWSQMPSRL